MADGGIGDYAWKIADIQQKRIAIDEAIWKLAEKPVADPVNLILADRPWQYDFAETDGRQIEYQYPSASVEEIESHINAPWAPPLVDDCVLFLWATAPKPRDEVDTDVPRCKRSFFPEIEAPPVPFLNVLGPTAARESRPSFP